MTLANAGLRSELRALGVPFVEAPLFRIAVDPARVHQLLRTVSTPLSSVQLHTPTLEDAYLAIVGRDEGQSELTE